MLYFRASLWYQFLADRYYVTFSLWRDPSICRPSVCSLSVCRLSATLLHHRQRLELFGNIFASPIIAYGLGQFVLKLLAKILRNYSSWAIVQVKYYINGAISINHTKRYQNLAFFDKYIALFRKRYQIRP